MKDRVIAYLAQGFEQVKVASMCGCSEAYVSQVAQDAKQEIAEEAKKHVAREEEHALEQTYMKLESRIIKAVGENLPFAEFGDLTKAMSVLIQRRQRTATPPGILFDNRTQVIMLQVPQAAVPELTLNTKREVVAVDGKLLAALPAPSVRSLFKRLEESRRARDSADAAEILSEQLEAHPLVLEEMPADF